MDGRGERLVTQRLANHQTRLRQTQATEKLLSFNSTGSAKESGFSADFKLNTDSTYQYNWVEKMEMKGIHSFEHSVERITYNEQKVILIIVRPVLPTRRLWPVNVETDE